MTLFDPHEWDARLRETVEPHILRTALVGADMEASIFKAVAARRKELSQRTEDILIGIPPEVAGHIRVFMGDLFATEYWERIQGVTAATTQRVLDTGFRDNLSTPDIARSLQSEFERMSDVRALRIARTETTGALNAGAWAVRQDLASDGLIRGQEWQSIIDQDTRSHASGDAYDHIQMDGQKVAANQQFNVSGEMAPFPGHFSLSAGNRIECRCGSASITILDDEIPGLPQPSGLPVQLDPSVNTPVGTTVPRGELTPNEIVRSTRHQDTQFPTDGVVRNRNNTKRTPEEMERLNQWVDEASEEAIDALKIYMGRDYRKINKALYETGDVPDSFQEGAQHIDAAMGKHGRSGGIVYRGVKLTGDRRKRFFEAIEQSVAEDKPVTFPAYSSTSLNPEIAHKFAAFKVPETPVIMEIRSKKGLYVNKFATLDWEEEYLMNRGSQVRVTRVFQGKAADGKDVIIVQGEQVEGAPEAIEVRSSETQTKQAEIPDPLPADRAARWAISDPLEIVFDAEIAADVDWPTRD